MSFEGGVVGAVAAIPVRVEVDEVDELLEDVVVEDFVVVLKVVELDLVVEEVGAVDDVLEVVPEAGRH